MADLDGDGVPDAQPIDLIRRPQQNSNENTAKPLTYQQRFFSQAAIRILLSDTSADITNLPTVTATPAPLSLGAGTFNGANVAVSGAAAGATPLNMNPGSNSVYKVPAGTPLLGGVIKIEQRTNAAPNTWTDITNQILGYGIVGRNLTTLAGAWSTAAVNTSPVCAEATTASPNAIIRLQRVRDIPSVNSPCGTVAGTTPGSDYWPLTLYDPREGNLRDAAPNGDNKYITLGGVMHYVELDINNLRKWLLGQAPYTTGTGPATRNDNGFIVYFSDRRGNRNGSQETGEYGFEDNVNPSVTNGTPNDAMDSGEDLNTPQGATATFDNYGKVGAVIAGAAAPYIGGSGGGRPWTPFDTSTSVSGTPVVPVGKLVPRANPQIFFRRALKIVNGGTLPAEGLTIASENPVYVQGSYNNTTDNAAANDAHVPAAILADAVTVLSKDWNDIRSFNSPNAIAGRPGKTTGYRMAVVAGKTVSFPKPTWSTVEDFGTDGGAHNFLRYIEDWGGQTINYRGSIVSFFTSRQATGIYKCCTTVYGVPTRAFNFDVDFLLPSKLPPGTPMFRDVNTLTFRQLLRPNQ